MSEYEHLLYDLHEGVATVTLNRPDAGNALNTPAAQELARVSNRCYHDRAVRAVLLTGNGRLFCAGGDLATMAAAGSRVDEAIKELTDHCHLAYSNFLRMQAPLVVAANGAAAGIGLSLTLISDLTLAAATAKFTVAYTAAGLSPDGGATWLLPRTVGVKRARELILTNRRLSAEEALDWGLVNQVHSADELMPAASELAASLAKGPTEAFGTARQLLMSSFSESLESQMVLEAQGIARCAASPDGQEGIDAFLNKRVPVFPGR